MFGELAEITAEKSLDEQPTVIKFKKRSKTGEKSHLRVSKSDRSTEERAETEKEREATIDVKPQPSLRSVGLSIKGEKVKVVQSGVATVYASSREAAPHQFAGDATATVEIDTARDRDTQAVLERKNDSVKLREQKMTGTVGPIRAPAFLRSTVRFDYQPNICKDYKETGFCARGDTCIFLHDRGDYKSGWQLEKEWEAVQRKKQRQSEEDMRGAQVRDVRLKDGDDSTTPKIDAKEEDEENYEIDEEGDGEGGFPFACHICRERFTDPVVTFCGHYFCQECAMQRNRVNTRCAVCDKQTHGVFNIARRLIQFMEEKRRKASASTATKDLEANTNERPSMSVCTKRKGTWETLDDR